MSPGAARRHLDDLLAVGPRPTGSAGENAAARTVAERFRATGLDVDTREFEVSRWPYRIATRILPGAAALVCAWAGFSRGASPVAVASVAGALAALIALAAAGHPFVERPFALPDRVRSVNVAGRSRGSRQGGPALVFSAHLDTKTCLLPMGVQITAALVGFGAIAALACAAALAAAGAWEVPEGLSRGLGAAGAAGFALVAGNAPWRPSPGALDNASGVALLLALAEALPGRLGGRADLVFLATGAEEIGLAGAMRFLRDGAGNLAPARTVVVNFDTLGTGNAVRISGSRRASEAFRGPLAAALAARGLKLRGLVPLVGAGMDHQRFRAAGFRAFSLTQGLGRAAFSVHAAWDRGGRVDGALLDRIAEAMIEATESLAGASGSRG